MSQRRTDGKRVALRSLTATGCIAAVLLALVLSALPQLHEQIHEATGAPNHECAVTLLTSGNYQHTPNATISLGPPPSPMAFVHTLANFRLITAHLEFSLLEHAPPVIS
jgi:predicted metal-binding membrane protein